MAQEALIGLTIPGPFGCPSCRILRDGVSIWTSDKTRRVGYNVISIVTCNKSVDLVSGHSGGTGSRFEMKDQRRSRDEGAVAVSQRTLNRCRSMGTRSKVLLEVVIVPKMTVARAAIMVVF